MKGSRDDDTPVAYQGETYCGIEEIGFNERGAFVIGLWTTKPAERRGSLSTGIPISPVDYRRQRPTKCGYKVVSETEIVIYGDGGNAYSYSIGSTAQVIAQLVQELEANEVPRRN